MKVLIAYSSRTGNTKVVCDAAYDEIKDLAEVDYMTVKEAKDIDSYDLIVVGFWVDKGTANKKAMKFIQSIRGKKVALLGTLGAPPDSFHGEKCVKNVKELVDASNEYLGVRLSRGKVDPKLTKAIKFLPLNKEIRQQMYDSSITSRPPNEEEIQAVRDFIKSAL